MMTDTQDRTQAALKNLTPSQLGAMVLAAGSEEILSHEDLGKAVRTGKLDHVSDEDLGHALLHAYQEEILKGDELELAL